MLNQLFDWLLSFYEHINPFVIIREYQQGLLLRLGEFKKVLNKGLHFKIPFIDEVMLQHVVLTTLNLSAQSLYTKDKCNIVVKAVIKYKISDIKVFLLEVFDSVDAIGDVTQGIIKNIIMEKTFEECLSSEIDNIITKKVRVECKKWGVEIAQVTLSDIAPIKTIRLINESTNLQLN